MMASILRWKSARAVGRAKSPGEAATISGKRTGTVWRLRVGAGTASSAAAEAVRLRLSWEHTRPHVGGVARRRRLDRRAQVAVAADEFRRPFEQAQHVIGPQDLPVAARTGADADRRAETVAVIAWASSAATPSTT